MSNLDQGYPKTPPDQAAEIRAAGAALEDGFSEMDRLLEGDSVDLGIHTSVPFSEAIVDGLGTFTNGWQYTQGCRPLRELTEKVLNVGEVRVGLTAPDGVRKLVVIGRTPAQWDTRVLVGGKRGRQISPDAGEVGDYLMAIDNMADVSADNSNTRFRYLDPIDLDGVRLEPGGEFIFGVNPGRDNRQISMHGAIDTVSAYRP